MTRAPLWPLLVVVLLLALVVGFLVRPRDAAPPMRVVTTATGTVLEPAPTVEPDVTMPTTTTTTTAVVRLVPKARTAPTVWDALRRCECPSGWHCNTGNGYFGGLQMDMPFWRTYGGLEFAERPDLASRDQQIVVAERGRADRGFYPWPTCAARLGLIA